jgi:hypothetical protein
LKIQTLGVDSRVMRHIPQQSCVLQKVDKLGVCWRRWDLQSTDEAKMEELLQVPVSYVLVAANEPDDLRARKKPISANRLDDFETAFCELPA